MYFHGIFRILSRVTTIALTNRNLVQESFNSLCTMYQKCPVSKKKGCTSDRNSQDLTVFSSRTNHNEDFLYLIEDVHRDFNEQKSNTRIPQHFRISTKMSSS